MAKISIIVPVYKAEKYIFDCLDSLKNQTLSDIEIILIDDGSPDNCGQICDEYAEEDLRIKVIHKVNGGVSAARNDGLNAAAGEYVIFCDSDDFMEKTACEILYHKAKQFNADLAIGDVYLTSEAGNKYVRFYKNEFCESDKSFTDELIKADIYRTYCSNPPQEGPAFGYGGPWNKLVRRELLIKNHIQFDLSVMGIFDDILYTAYVLVNADKICYVQKPVYYYRILPSSITHSFKPNAAYINDAIFNAWMRFFNEYDQESKYLPAYYACVIRRTEESMKTYFTNSKNTKSIKTLKSEFKAMMHKSPYKEAIRRVEISKLSKKQKLIVIFSRISFTSGVLKLYKSNS